GVDPEQLGGLDPEAGLLAQLAAHGDLRILALFEPASRHRPRDPPTLRPAREQDTILLVGDDSVCGDAQIHVFTVTPVRRRTRAGVAGHSGGLQFVLTGAVAGIDVLLGETDPAAA